MNENDVVRLRHMLDAAREAVSFAEGVTEDALKTDRKLALALVKDIEIIGEAASQISSALREENPQIPWDVIIGMRHRLVHAYFDINFSIVWETATSNLPPLITQLEQILAQEKDTDA